MADLFPNVTDGSQHKTFEEAAGKLPRMRRPRRYSVINPDYKPRAEPRSSGNREANAGVDIVSLNFDDYQRLVLIEKDRLLQVSQPKQTTIPPCYLYIDHH